MNSTTGEEFLGLYSSLVENMREKRERKRELCQVLVNANHVEGWKKAALEINTTGQETEATHSQQYGYFTGYTCFSFLAMLDFEPRALSTLSMYSATEPHPRPLGPLHVEGSHAGRISIQLLM